MTTSAWAEVWPQLASFVMGVVLGAFLVWDRAWLAGKRQGYAWGRQDERTVCHIEHSRRILNATEARRPR